MTKIVFNKRSFIRTMVIFLALTILWTVLSVLTNEFTNNDKGFVSGLGYLILLAASIYFGQMLKRFHLFGSLILCTISTFIIASFFLGPLLGFITNSMLLYSIGSALFVSTVTTFWLNKLVRIEFKGLTMAATFIFLLIAYFITFKLELDFDLHPRLAMFIVFQLALIIPLTLGMTLKKASTQQ